MLLAHENRIKAQQPRGRAGWCMGCDKAAIRVGQKCPVCGYKERIVRARKPSPMGLDEL
jgi:hypothetical protein